MEKTKITYRLANIKNSREDIDTILKFEQMLSDYLNEEILDDAAELREDIIFRAVIAKNSKSCFYLAEYNGIAIGYIEVSYYPKKFKWKDSCIKTIFVDDEYRNGDIAYNLLKLGLRKLNHIGKNTARVWVQEDNPNRFLHFAIADRCISIEHCRRKDGKEVKAYELLISNIERILNMTKREIAKKAIKLKREKFNPLQYNKQPENTNNSY